MMAPSVTKKPLRRPEAKKLIKEMMSNRSNHVNPNIQFGLPLLIPCNGRPKAAPKTLFSAPSLVRAAVRSPRF